MKIDSWQRREVQQCPNSSALIRHRAISTEQRPEAPGLPGPTAVGRSCLCW